MLSNKRQQILEKFANIVAKTLFEARILRTIDPKIWATVASGISKKYKADMGLTCKARSTDTKEILLQKYVSALLILRQPCPQSQAEFENSKVFPLWAKQLIAQGVTLAEITTLYNQNSGKVGISNAAPVLQPVVKNEPAQLVSKPATKAQVNEDECIKVVVNLRTLIPSTEGGGHEDELIETVFVPYADAGKERLLDVVRATVDTYNTPSKKYKCRDGWYSRYYQIEITDPEYDVKAEIEITRERIQPLIHYYINGVYQMTNGALNIKQLYNGKPVEQKIAKQSAPKEEEEMPRWKVTYDDGDDISSVWVYANTKNEAIGEVYREYHDVKKILLVTRIK